MRESIGFLMKIKDMAFTKRRMVVLLFVVLAAMGGRLYAQDTAGPVVVGDSAHFVTASLLTVSPGPAVYSVFGHTAIRMQCPSKGLDYCFSFESELTPDYLLRFFAGECNATFVARKTGEFLAGFKAEGRGVTQCELNLTPHEKQELWRSLDEDMVEGAHRKFNLLQNNCTSMVLIKIESVLESETIEYGAMPPELSLVNGALLRHCSRRSPWAQFLFATFVGSESDKYWETEFRLAPETFIPVLSHATIRSTISQGAGRPVLVGGERVLLPLRNTYDATSPLTPNRVSGVLLALAFVYALWRAAGYRRSRGAAPREGRGRDGETTPWRMAGRGLAVAYGVVALFLLYVTVVSGLFGIHWNWLLIPFNIVPVVVWLVFRKKKNYPQVYLFYAAVLALFVAVVPWLTTQVMTAHLLLVGALCLLCVGHYLRWRTGA